jgi:hypothetical protein
MATQPLKGEGTIALFTRLSCFGFLTDYFLELPMPAAFVAIGFGVVVNLRGGCCLVIWAEGNLTVHQLKLMGLVFIIRILDIKAHATARRTLHLITSNRYNNNNS